MSTTKKADGTRGPGRISAMDRDGNGRLRLQEAATGLEARVVAFLAVQKAEHGLSKTTLDGYGCNIRRFVRYLQETGTPEPVMDDFCRRTVRAFLQRPAAAALRPRSVRIQIVSLKMFGAWAVAEGLAEANPVADIAYPKLDSPTRDTVTDAEVLALLAACDRLYGANRRALARAVMSCLAYAALRRGELLNLRLADVSLAERSVTVVHGKGGKTRVVYPHPECFAALRSWLALRPPCDHDYLFSHNRTRRMWDGGLFNLLAELKASAGLADIDRIHPHAFRRGCATRLLNQGYTIFDVQHFLGHSDLRTTQIYIAPDEQRLKKIADRGGLALEDDRPVQKPQSIGGKPTRYIRRKKQGRAYRPMCESSLPATPQTGSAPQPLLQQLAPVLIQILSALLPDSAKKSPE